MNKTDFMLQLNNALHKAHVPQNEARDAVQFYAECVDERVEDGATEAEAIEGLGSIDSIVESVVADLPKAARGIGRLDSGNKALKVILLVLTFPVWGSILVSLALVATALIAVLWSLLAAAAALWIACITAGLAGIAALVHGAANGAGQAGALGFGIGIALSGLAVVLLPLMVYVCRWLAFATVRLSLWVSRPFMKASTYEKGSAFAARVKGGWPHVPRTLLVVGLVLLLLGAAVALAVLASCGFEPWTLAQAPSVNLFGQDVYLFHWEPDGTVLFVGTLS